MDIFENITAIVERMGYYKNSKENMKIKKIMNESIIDKDDIKSDEDNDD